MPLTTEGSVGMDDARTTRSSKAASSSWSQSHAAFEWFYAEELRAVVQLAYALTGSRTAAEDIAQEAFVRAFRYWDRLAGTEHRRAWVRRVAANLAVSWLRRKLVEARALGRLGAQRTTTLDSLPAPHEEFWRAVRALPRRQAQSIALHYLEDHSVRDVASILGCAEGTVKAHPFKARRTLARRLGVEE
jgi:RNA polymerase sigma factor (sigma-70 family)